MNSGIIVPDGTRYTIEVSYAQTDPLTTEWMYRARVKEYPDVECWGHFPDQAYWLAVDAVEGLAVLAIEMDHNYPRAPYASN